MCQLNWFVVACVIIKLKRMKVCEQQVSRSADVAHSNKKNHIEPDISRFATYNPHANAFKINSAEKKVFVFRRILRRVHVVYKDNDMPIQSSFENIWLAE